MAEVIHARVYDPHSSSIFKGKANEKASCTTVSCTNRDNCGLLKRGQCATLAFIDSKWCPYGAKKVEEGPTKRAKSYREWLDKRSKMYEGVPRLKDYSKRMAVVGDYVFLPYAHMNMNKELPVKAHGHFMSSGTHFVRLEDFTPELVVNILQFNPHALMGGAIGSYQKEVVPVFLKHLREDMPELFAKVVELMPRAADTVAAHTNVKRKALLRSLKPGTVVPQYEDSDRLDTVYWTWDGAKLWTVGGRPSFMPVEYSSHRIELTPKEDAHIVVSSDSQVDEDTVYLE